MDHVVELCMLKIIYETVYKPKTCVVWMSHHCCYMFVGIYMLNVMMENRTKVFW